MASLLVEPSSHLLSLLNFYFYFCLLNYLPTCWTCWIFTSTSACWSICPPVASEENRATPFYLLAPTCSGPPPTTASAIPILAWDTALKNCCNQIFPFDFCQTKYWSLRGGAAAEMRLLSLRNWMFNHNFSQKGQNNIILSCWLGGFHALTKIRQSLREKKPPLGKRAGTIEDVSQELDAVKVDLQVRSCGTKAFI